MKRLLQILCVAMLMPACNLIDSEIDGEKVDVNDTTKIYTYKENDEKISGTVVFYELDPLTAKKFKQAVREVKKGIRINKGYDYYPNGNINVEYSYDEDGLITGTLKVFYISGQVYSTKEFKKDKENGVSKEFRINSTQLKETTYEMGNKINSYDFDETGMKIIPAIEKLELLKFETGFFEYRDLNSYQVLYQPMVIMRWKNISDKPLEDKVVIDGVFISNEEEWSKDTEYFQGYSDTPLQPGLSRQASIQSSVGYTSYYSIDKAKVSCQIFINQKLYKTIEIENKHLTSNRIQ